MRYAKYFLLIGLGLALGIAFGSFGNNLANKEITEINRAEDHFRRGQYFEGYKELIMIEPQNPLFDEAQTKLKQWQADIITDLYLRAESHLGKGEYNLAQSYVNQILSLNPQELRAQDLNKQIRTIQQEHFQEGEALEISKLKLDEERTRREIKPWNPPEDRRLGDTPYAKYLKSYRDLGVELGKLTLAFSEVVEGYHLGEVTDKEFNLVRLEMINQLERLKRDFEELYNPLPGGGKSQVIKKVISQLSTAIRGLQLEGEREIWLGLIDYNKGLKELFQILEAGYDEEG